VAPDYATKDNRQGHKKALSKENQELSRGASPALPKPNRNTSRAGYRHSPRASDKYSINSLKKKKDQIAFFYFFLNILKAFLTVNHTCLVTIIKKLGFLS
jgi:hypothetical protein